MTKTKNAGNVSEKTFKGYIQVYTGKGKGKTTAALGVALRPAGKGTYSNGYDIYILEYKDAEASQMAFDSVKKDFKDAVKYQNVTTGQGHIELEDDSGTQIVVQPYRSFILIVLGTKSPAQATQILKNLKNHIN